MNPQAALPIVVEPPRWPHPSGVGNLPAWVGIQLEENKQTPTASKARYQRCRDCDAAILAALDHPRCGGTARVDPTPLSRQDEIAALIAGRATYNAIANRLEFAYELQLRGPFEMRGRRHAVVPAHKCGARFAGFLEPPEHPSPATDEFPF